MYLRYHSFLVPLWFHWLLFLCWFIFIFLTYTYSSDVGLILQTSPWYSQPRWSHLPHSFKRHLFPNKSQIYFLPLTSPTFQTYMAHLISPLECVVDILNLCWELKYWLRTFPLTKQTFSLPLQLFPAPMPPISGSSIHLISLFKTWEPPYHLFNKQLFQALLSIMGIDQLCSCTRPQPLKIEFIF